MSKYNLAQIGIEFKEDGTPMYWVYNYGYHPGQGGMEFTYGNFGTPSLEKSLDLLKERLVRNIDYILEEIKREELKEVMIVKKMFGLLIDNKFVSHEELALEFEKLQAENKKLRDALESIANSKNYPEPDYLIAREALKEVGEK